MEDRFRVWCSHHRKYEAHKMFLDQDGNLYHIVNDENKIGLIGATKANPNTHKLEFCTGLKDKNGKLIYEGDIIKVYKRIGQIIFDRRGCYFGLKISDVETWGFSMNFMETSEIEVVGNIYETPPQEVETKNHHEKTSQDDLSIKIITKDKQEVEKCEFMYQKLFNYLDKEHNGILLESDLQQIYDIVNDDLQRQLQQAREENEIMRKELINNGCLYIQGIGFLRK